MKLIHLSDLHLGIRVNEFSMAEDQEYILSQILKTVSAEAPDAVLIAGDVYDKSVPSAEAVRLFSSFLASLSELKIRVFVSAGNHDSAERLAFARELLNFTGVHISPVFTGEISPITLADEHGDVNIYMLPFVKPSAARHCYEDEKIETYNDAVAAAIAHISLNTSSRNILLAHQFVTGANTCESEELSVGGSENVSAELFRDFDYVALGHLHGPQNITPNIRYCGTPLKYSFSEAGHQKSLTVVELGKKGELLLRTVPLLPLRDMVRLRGSFSQITSRDFYANTAYPESYVSITLTDEEEQTDIIGTLRQIYPYMMQLSYDNTRTRASAKISADTEISEKSPLQVFSDLFEVQNGQPMSSEQEIFMQNLIESIWEAEK